MNLLARALLLAIIGSVTIVPGARSQSSVDLLGSGRTSALGYASTALGTTAGTHANPAAAAFHRRRLATFYIRENYGVTALRYGSLYATWPREWGVFSGGASTFGDDVYREIHYSLGFARGFQLGTTRSVYIGVRGRYYQTRIDGYGRAGALGLHVGLLVPLLPSVHFGAQITNLNAPSLSDGKPLPQTLSVGLTYRATTRVRAMADVFKDLARPASVRGGVEVRPLSALALRAGVTTAPVRFTGGVGLRVGSIRVHVAAEQHSELGWSPSASIEVHW